MNISQIKELMISSLNSDADANEVSGKLKEAGYLIISVLTSETMCLINFFQPPQK